ncbi:hypothetical protein [Halalkalibacter flavus]|uniref:hypothetical protein n=1 Tax=Halalkalibacter flavus TaxID=3090668 RepID=UPI002FC9DA5F
MAKYIVIKDFADLQDNGHVYHAGDKFPRKGRVKNDRIEELSSTSNKIGEVLIQEVGEE